MTAPNVFNAATSQWVHGAAIADPSGGAFVDSQARTATNGILSALRACGVLAGATALNSGHTWTQAQRVALVSDIAEPSGGVSTDSMLRTAIGTLLAALRKRGVLAGSLTVPALVYDEDAGSWSQTAIADVSGGVDVDAECRAAINDALAALRHRGFIAQD